MVLKFQSNSPVVHLASNTHPSLMNPAIVTCTKNLQFCINKWNDVRAHLLFRCGLLGRSAFYIAIY